MNTTSRSEIGAALLESAHTEADTQLVSSRRFQSLDVLGRSPKAWLVLVLFTVGVRIAFASMIPILQGIANERYGDFIGSLMSTDDYEKIARNLASGHGYRIRPDLGETMLRNPAYVLVLTGLFTLFGESRVLVQILGAVIAGCVVLLLRRVGEPVIGAGPTFLAAILYALYPADWLATVRYSAEPLLLLFMLLWLLALRRFLCQPGLPWGLMVGALAGAMALTKSVAIYLLPAMLVWLVLCIPSVRQRSKTFIMASLVALMAQMLMLLPWGAYNYQRSGHWVFSSTIVGWALFDSQYLNRHPGQGTAPGDRWLEARKEARRVAEEAGYRPDPRDPWTFNFYELEDEVGTSELLKRIGVQAILDNPVLYLRGVLRNATAFWYVGSSRGFTYVGLVMNIPLLLLGIYGVLRGRVYRSPEGRIWIGVIGYMNLITALSFAVARYAVPIMPIVFLLAAASFSRKPVCKDRLNSAAISA